MATPPSARTVKIAQDERTGWSSDRPRREGGPERPANLSVRSRVLSPSDTLRYSPGGLVVIVSASESERERFARRVAEDKGSVLSLAKVRGLLSGKVEPGQLEERAAEVLAAAVGKRLSAGEGVIVLAGVQPDERAGHVRTAIAAGRPRHLVLLDVGRDQVEEGDREAANELRSALTAGGLGTEGFATALRLGGSATAEVKRVVFRPPPSDD